MRTSLALLALAVGGAVVVGDVSAQPATVRFSDCFSGSKSQKLNVSTVYGQMFDADARHLNLTVLGTSPQDIIGSANLNLATLFTTTEMLTLDVWDNSTYFCQTLRPPSPLPSTTNGSSLYCPIPAGPFAFSTYIPLDSARELATLQTRLHAVDPSSAEILCIDVFTTNLAPGTWGSVYGHAIAIFWFTVALAIAYWLLVLVARIVSAWGRGVARTGTGVWGKVERVGFVFASALSGERFAVSPALMRFCTPSMRDILFHTQWVAGLSMVAVQWPSFVYPLAAQTAWSMLSYNITLTQGSKHPLHWNPVSVPAFHPPSNFADQLTDPTSPLFVDTSNPNTLFTLPPDARTGIPSFAYAVGLRPEDLFGICMGIFLLLLAAVCVISLVIKLFAALGSSGRSAMGSRGRSHSPGPYGARAGGPAASKDVLSESGVGATDDSVDNKSHQSHFLFSRAVPAPSKSRFINRIRPNLNSFHLSILHGALVRVLIWFHFPITLFAAYHMTLPRSHAPLSSVVLAALSFAFFSVLIPGLLLARLALTSTSKLYDETCTLLALGPLYNHYRAGSQLFAGLFFLDNLAMGLTIGAGQRSGTAQAIIILVVEVVSALTTSLWLPWGQGASMGLISFLFCVGRIVIAVLVVILTPVVSIGQAAGGWVAYAILLILALIYLAFVLILFVKIIEGITRICGGVSFDRSRHVVDSGLIGACGLLGCCGGGRQQRRRRRYRASDARRPSSQPFALPSSALQQNNQSTLNSQSQTLKAESYGPPSVLRPEHAMRPYKETDDEEQEAGYIMGAWQPFPRPGYNALAEQHKDSFSSNPSTLVQSTPAPAASSSGFARVGGGRAHYEDPYHIATRSSLTFPSADHSIDRAERPTLARHLTNEREEDEVLPTASVVSFARQPTPLTPHQRTRSQTAIVEDVALLRNMFADAHEVRPLSPGGRKDENAVVDDDDDDDESVKETPRHRGWFSLGRKTRRHSEIASPPPAPLNLSADPGPSEAGPSTGRSFVVVRKQQPGIRQQSASLDLNRATEDRPGRSFEVLRGKDV
ncbi:hypothetical protein PUNSTDRAFT_64002 [Punctularia strigosozonata HHB-11173 SS5]|uniref:uncharacterized protein n=1 Tax=Punctularia strigosozonata (strain HHB-11173) TaxID=741275 RepID=UPI0004416C0D|nr:uncharacterized protein PUNSTDRAFT_64002 [Punctularia strigosozonata HHB-11173 SS5]EIN11076.1 hypothetical protein PUNSTDRAFT_64002 [Punctularia strigosozonata HHB-11173 SS5]